MSEFIRVLKNIAKANRAEGNFTLYTIYNNDTLGIIVGESAIFEDDTILPHLGVWDIASSLEDISRRVDEHPRMASIIENGSCDIYGSFQDFVSIITVDNVIEGCLNNPITLPAALKDAVDWFLMVHFAGLRFLDE